ncbi:enoyl-CoA hydratase [Parasphingopyxis marina]|uniref:Enoyl-CoA hydratase n=1 Tax=Parasphingopyxis marina TaxID=2761622 RepID=A0A842I287_9SPHN|nr:enoyl-CoA hydratase [Parasphingopyxis marina]MBC2778941.1 enoyl-CoA hydratase [Parasphingopyxis marina]
MTPEHIRYETPEPGIARIIMDRPQAANAQDTQFLYELNDAFDRAAADDDIQVIILAATGKHFSAGHDIRERDHHDNQDRYRPVTPFQQHRRPGAEGRMSREEELYTGFCERWRNLPKITIAAVQGKCVSGGLLLCWPCDLIVAADDAQFQEVTVAMGIAGVEWFAHPWEMNARKAKEMLLTGEPIGADEARQLGMINRVVPADRLEAETLDLAMQIARQPGFATRMVKQAVNAAQDAQGRHSAFQTAFALHQLAHSHAMEVHGLPIDPTGIHESVSRHYGDGEEPFRTKGASASAK